MSASKRKREWSREKGHDPLSNKSKQICIHIERETYARILLEPQALCNYLDAFIRQHPELFPPGIERGYTLHDTLPESKKMPGIRLRRIKIAVPEGDKAQVYTIRPSLCVAIYDWLHGCSGESLVSSPLGGSSLGLSLCLWARRTVLVPARESSGAQ